MVLVLGTLPDRWAVLAAGQIRQDPWVVLAPAIRRDRSAVLAAGQIRQDPLAVLADDAMAVGCCGNSYRTRHAHRHGEALR